MPRALGLLGYCDSKPNQAVFKICHYVSSSVKQLLYHTSKFSYICVRVKLIHSTSTQRTRLLDYDIIIGTTFCNGCPQWRAIVVFHLAFLPTARIIIGNLLMSMHFNSKNAYKDNTGFSLNLFRQMPSKNINYRTEVVPSRQFWDCGRWKSDSLWNFSIVGCQWTVNCLLGFEHVCYDSWLW